MATTKNIIDLEAKPTLESDVGNSTTSIHNDTKSQHYEPPLHKDLTKGLIAPQVITPIQDIKTFLRRPYLLRNGTWTSAMTGTFIAVDLPYEALHKTIYTPKVQGFLNFRATAVVRLQVNANRFCQGRLIMHFIPQAQIAGTYPNNRNTTMMQITQQPNVQLDANTDSEAVMRIPYVSPKLFYDLTTGKGPMGVLYVSVYSSLLYGVGGLDADYSLWIHFEDVELEIPVLPGTFLTQASVKGPRENKGITTNVVKKKQVGMSPTDEENPQGPISSLSKRIADVANTISMYNIPQISDVAGTVGWASNAISGVASFFGFSNPRSEEMHKPYKKSIWNHCQNNDGGTHSEMLSYSVSNKLELLDGLGPSGLDEAAFNYMLSKSVFWNGPVWTATNAYNDIITTFEIQKNQFRVPSTMTDGTNHWHINYWTPVGFMMSYFKYWRGSIKIKLKFVKTEFHTGRLIISYLPHPNAITPGTITIEDTNYLLREIIDLRESNEFEFTIPYTNNKSWIDANDRTGSVFVHVLNPLVFPEAAATNIRMLIEVSAGSDFEVCGFEPQTNANFTPVLENSSPFVKQMGSLPKEIKLTSSDNVIGNADVPGLNLAPSKFVMGEKLVSVYNIIKRASIGRKYDLTAGLEYSTNPFETAAMGVGHGASAFSIASIVGEPLSLFTSFFAYNRGSVVVKVNLRAASGEENFFTQLYNANNTATWHQSAIAQHFHGSVVQQKISTDQGACVSAPPYMELHTRLTRLSTADKVNFANYGIDTDEYNHLIQ